VKTTIGELRKLVREERERAGFLNELFGSRPDFSALLDSVMQDLSDASKKVEKAHGLAPEGTARAIVAGLHSDLFNKTSEFRKHIEQLKGIVRKSGSDKHAEG
jgi:hypothetical protein